LFQTLEAHGFEVALVKARHVKNIPGRPKTDRWDCRWRQVSLAHCATQYRIVPTQPGIIDLATELLQRHPLRAYDAVQLASASIVNQSLIAHGLPPLIFVTADDRLIAATRGESVTAENPNLHP
jgi:predicted nucleic acid-binding protein